MTTLDTMKAALYCMRKVAAPNQEFTDAVDALDEAIAREAQVEPAGYFVPACINAFGKVTEWAQVMDKSKTPLYTRPASAQLENTWFEDLRFVQRVLEVHATRDDLDAALEAAHRARKVVHALLMAPQAPARTPLTEAVQVLMAQAKWANGPVETQWGVGMMCADLEITPDETLTVFAHRDAVLAAQEAKP